MARPTVLSFPAMVTTAVCTAQTTAGAGALTIDGTLLDAARFASPTGTRAARFVGIQRRVSLTSAGDISGVNVTIVGTDLFGAAVTETRVGPSGNTVFTAVQYHIVTAVTVDAAVGTAMSVGTGDVGSTNWIMGDVNKDPFNMTVAVTIAATSNVTVQDTPDDAVTVASPTTYNHATLAAITASAESNYAYPARFVRAVMNSSSGNGAFTLTTIQAGIV